MINLVARVCFELMPAVFVRVYLAVAILAVVGVIIVVVGSVGAVVCAVEKLSTWSHHCYDRDGLSGEAPLLVRPVLRERRKS